ncbi:hypothetical protein ACFWN7_06890 [Agromyces sp. NPDC058484]|uniref:hypothetical protein n=1 Tax=Agromyces sp. NPDC058484 TaxID=3346524 RepID=UPI003656A3BB
MLEVTEAQVWTMIGVFTTLMVGMLTVVSTLFVRVLRSELGGVRSEIGRVEVKVDSLHAEMNARFESVDSRITGLDRDVQALVKHTFGLDRG